MKHEIMKPKYQHFPAWVALGLVMPASADVIYSNLQNIDIPASFAGLYLNLTLPYDSSKSNTSMSSPVAGWDINAYRGGMDLANSPAFQPVRANNTTNWAPVTDLAAGATVGSGSIFSPFVQGATGETPNAPGYGTSRMLTGSGGNFTAGTEGYVGFKLYTGANYSAAVYGWMRVVLGGPTPVIKDWAYDNGGGSLATGNVLQSGSTITLDSTHGSFALGSALTGSNSLVKDGTGTTTLKLANTYSGGTTVSNGTLLVNNTSGSGTGSGAVSVASGATVGGTGSIAGALTLNGGILSPGASIESLSSGALTLNTGSTFAYEMDSSAEASVAGDLQIVNGNLTLNGHINLTLSPSAFTANTTTLSLIQYTGSLLGGGGFFFGETALTEGTIFNDGLNNWKISYAATSGGLNFASDIPGSHFITLSNLTAIPEPGSWLAIACLIGAGAFLRGRRV